MIKKLLLILSFFLLGLSFVFPSDMTIWKKFIPELFSFLGLFFLSLHLVIKRTELVLPRISFIFIFIAFIPIVQFLLGQIALFTNAVISFYYIFAFSWALILAYQIDQKKMMVGLGITFVFFGVLSSIMALTQWLDVYNPYLPTLVLTHNRPYANLAQPNHLSTFLCMSCMSLWYLYEKNKINAKLALLISVFFIFAIALTQSRTAWVVCIATMIAFCFFNREGKFVLRFKILVLLIGVYSLFVLNLTKIGSLISQYFHLDVIGTTTAIHRATNEGDRERLEIWAQTWDLILQQPWVGYGWNQVGVAIIDKIDYFYFDKWYTSSHNIVLDLFMWVGLPIGIVIFIFLFYFLFKLCRNSHTTESKLALIMALPILIHANLEYPLFYAYFVIPLGLLLGVALFDVKNIKTIELNHISVYVVIFAYCISLYLVWVEYVCSLDQQSKAKILALERMANKNINNNIQFEDNFYILTSLKLHAEWVALDAYGKHSSEELNKYENFVKFNPSVYNLLKLSQVYYNNDNLIKSKEYLDVFNQLFEGRYTLDDLAKIRN